MQSKCLFHFIVIMCILLTCAKHQTIAPECETGAVVWLVEQPTPLEDWRCVVMESGVESATDSSTGDQTMLELSVASLDSPMKVVVKLQ